MGPTAPRENGSTLQLSAADSRPCSLPSIDVAAALLFLLGMDGSLKVLLYAPCSMQLLVQLRDAEVHPVPGPGPFRPPGATPAQY